MEEIEIEFSPEIVQDIEKHTISRATVDFIIHYENGLMTLKDLKDSKGVFVSEEFYNSLHPKPELFSITEFGLSVHSANGVNYPTEDTLN